MDNNVKTAELIITQEGNLSVAYFIMGDDFKRQIGSINYQVVCENPEIRESFYRLMREVCSYIVTNTTAKIVEGLSEIR